MYTMCSLIIAAVNAPISVPLLHGVSEWQHDECRYVSRFLPIHVPRYTNETRYLWSYLEEVHQIFKRCSHVIAVVNMHI